MARDLAAAAGLAVQLAQEAGCLQLSRRPGLTVLGTKHHPTDLLTDVDLASEQLIVEGLRVAWPGDGLLGEEGSAEPGTSGWRWVIDPLDGTRNYVSAAGPWSVCIALQEGETTRVAVVHDPVLGETFTAVSGTGARLNNVPISVAAVGHLDLAILGISFNARATTRARVAGLLPGLVAASGDFRRLPAALNLAYLAAGRLGCSLVVDTQPWDVAAGELLIKEAGAVIDGSPSSAWLIAAAPGIAEGFFAVVER